MQPAMTAYKRAWRYAQEQPGQRLHLVEMWVDGTEAQRALCGREPTSRGDWRMTINVPLANACRSCLKPKQLEG